MAHNLFSERFYSLREPAWHGLGTVSESEKTAVEIFNGMNPFIVTLEPVFTEIQGAKLELPNRVITRWPTPDDPEYRSFGVVGDEYTIVDPLRACEIWDESTRRFPETLGVLGQGESLFITTKLPTFEIRGEQVDSYLLLHNPYGDGAVQVRVTPIRVVCQNTLIAAKRQSTESFTIIHDSNVEKRLAMWMSGIVERAEHKNEVLADTFSLMAQTAMDDEAAKDLLTRIYVDPKSPRYVPDASVMEKREKAYEATVNWNIGWRERVMEDWQGEGMGMDSDACKGTAWGLYNAVVEIEDYRPTPSWAEASRGYNSLFGDRANRKEAAFSQILEYAEVVQR
jgi:phage/plasmid-like protein (TIGR03299 family)